MVWPVPWRGGDGGETEAAADDGVGGPPPLWSWLCLRDAAVGRGLLLHLEAGGLHGVLHGVSGSVARRQRRRRGRCWGSRGEAKPSKPGKTSGKRAYRTATILRPVGRTPRPRDRGLRAPRTAGEAQKFLSPRLLAAGRRPKAARSRARLPRDEGSHLDGCPRRAQRSSGLAACETLAKPHASQQSACVDRIAHPAARKRALVSLGLVTDRWARSF